MNKRTIIKLCAIFIVFFSLSISAACPLVTSDSVSGFCQNFEQASECQCAMLGSDQCGDMETIYKNMVGNFGPDSEQAINAACQLGESFGWAKKQDCIDQWHCYLHGGTDSHGAKCYGNNGPSSNCQTLSSVDTQPKLCRK